MYIINKTIFNFKMAEQQYIINKRARRDKYKEYKAIENNERLKQRVEDLKTKNTISSILKSQRTSKNIDDNINTLIDQIKDENPEMTQEQVKNTLQQKYNVRNAKVPEFKSITEADEIFNKMSLLGKSSVYNKYRATQDPELKARLYELYKFKGKPTPIAPGLPPFLGPRPVGAPAPAPAPRPVGRPPGPAPAPIPAPAPPTGPPAPPTGPILPILPIPPTGPLGPPAPALPTGPVLTQKQRTALKKAQSLALSQSRAPLLPPSPPPVKKATNITKKTGKGFKHINPKYFTSFNTMY